MEVPVNLEELLSPDENGIVVLSGKYLSSLSNGYLNRSEPRAVEKTKILKNIINQLGVMSSNVLIDFL